jgi:hypothetical protein
MDCVLVSAGEFLIGSALAKDREAYRVSCLRYAPGYRSGHVGFRVALCRAHGEKDSAPVLNSVGRVAVAVECLKPHAQRSRANGGGDPSAADPEGKGKAKGSGRLPIAQSLLPKGQWQQDQKYKAFIYLRVNSGCTVNST